MPSLGLTFVVALFAIAHRARKNAGSAGDRKITARFRSRCSACSQSVLPGMDIHWNPDTRAARHLDCQQARATVEQDVVTTALSRIEASAGPSSRRKALEIAVRELSGQARQNLLLEAGRIEVTAVLDKVEALKTAKAKRRHLEAALAALQADEVSDELQAEQLAWLQDAICSLDE